MNAIKPIAFLLAASLFMTGCAFKRVTRTKDITYNKTSQLKLDVYSPKKIKDPKNVLVFVHGGNWNSGKKSLYHFFGNRMARKGVVTVVVEYRLSPITEYKGMTEDISLAVKWTKENIKKYGGDDSRIFVSGHSAGGHLVALVSTDPRYFEIQEIPNPIRGTILIDAFGLDMYSYLTSPNYKKNGTYYDMFSRNPETWKSGSPYYHLREGMAPYLIFVGGKTHAAIKEENEEFVEALKKYQPAEVIVVKHKKHIAMMTQFLNTGNKRYRQIIDFMNK